MPERISKFHYITQDMDDFSHPELAAFACKGGVNWVQLRIKNRKYSECLTIARETKIICDKYNAKLIINDNVQIAQEVSAYGVHLGKEDMSPGEARNFLGADFIIGGTANSLEDLQRLNELNVDYIGLGPFRFTFTKKNLSPVLGLEAIKNIVGHSTIPVIAIGGIQLSDIPLLMQTGIYGIAVSSAINLSEDKIRTAQKFIEI